MGCMLRFEIHRLIRLKSFYICSVVSLLFLFISCLIGWLPGKELGMYLYTRQSALCSSLEMSSVTMILSVFIPIMICEDYEQQTLKNIIARGYGSGTVFYAKLLTALLAGIVMTLLILAGGELFGVVFFEAEEQSLSELISLLLGQLTVILAYTVFYTFISISVRRVGGAIALSFFLPLLISLALNMITTLMKSEEINPADYWIGSFLTNLLPGADGAVLKRCIIGSCAYMLLFTLMGRWIGQIRDNQ